MISIAGPNQDRRSLKPLNSLYSGVPYEIPEYPCKYSVSKKISSSNHYLYLNRKQLNGNGHQIEINANGRKHHEVPGPNRDRLLSI